MPITNTLKAKEDNIEKWLNQPFKSAPHIAETNNETLTIYKKLQLLFFTTAIKASFISKTSQRKFRDIAIAQITQVIDYKPAHRGAQKKIDRIIECAYAGAIKNKVKIMDYLANMKESDLDPMRTMIRPLVDGIRGKEGIVIDEEKLEEFCHISNFVLDVKLNWFRLIMLPLMFVFIAVCLFQIDAPAGFYLFEFVPLAFMVKCLYDYAQEVRKAGLDLQNKLFKCAYDFIDIKYIKKPNDDFELNINFNPFVPPVYDLKNESHNNSAEEKNNPGPKLKIKTRKSPVKVEEESSSIKINNSGADEKTTPIKSVYPEGEEEFEFGIKGSSRLFARIMKSCKIPPDKMSAYWKTIEAKGVHEGGSGIEHLTDLNVLGENNKKYKVVRLKAAGDSMDKGCFGWEEPDSVNNKCVYKFFYYTSKIHSYGNVVKKLAFHARVLT